jgi:hypothetical protein
MGDGPYGAPFVLRTAADWLYTMDYQHRCSPCYWVVIPPSARRLLESYLRCVQLDMYIGDFIGAPCSQFVHHLQLWVPLQKLRRLRVTFTVVYQEPGDVIVFMPGTYYQGWVTGAIVSECAYYSNANTNADSNANSAIAAAV